MSIADNIFTGREIKRKDFLGKYLGMLDKKAMEQFAREKLTELGLMTVQSINQSVETLSGGQRQDVAVARAAAFAKKFIIMDEPTAAFGVKESRRVLELIKDVRDRGIPIVLISHNMPHVYKVADRIHIHRLGKRLCVIDPKDYIHVRCRGLHDRRQRASGRRRGIAQALDDQGAMPKNTIWRHLSCRMRTRTRTRAHSSLVLKTASRHDEKQTFEQSFANVSLGPRAAGAVMAVSGPTLLLSVNIPFGG